MIKHQCPNRYNGEGAKGACYVDIQSAFKEGKCYLEVGWSCVVVHHKEIPVSWLAEVIAIATSHKDGIKGFLKEHGQGGSDEQKSYALWVDPNG